MSSRSTIDLARAFDFAARKHRDQRRKGAAAEPYVNHPAEVARLLAEATCGEDPACVVAGLLHDTLEDTETTREELVSEFGHEVAELVGEVTDDKRLPKAERKRLQVERAPGSSRRAKMIKIADKTSNLRSLVTSPPTDWSTPRRLEYLDWAAEVVAGCRGVHAGLETAFDAALEEARRALGRDAST